MGSKTINSNFQEKNSNLVDLKQEISQIKTKMSDQTISQGYISRIELSRLTRLLKKAEEKLQDNPETESKSSKTLRSSKSTVPKSYNSAVNSIADWSNLPGENLNSWIFYADNKNWIERLRQY